jgi:hypothetical protein
MAIWLKKDRFIKSLPNPEISELKIMSPDASVKKGMIAQI